MLIKKIIFVRSFEITIYCQVDGKKSNKSVDLAEKFYVKHYYKPLKLFQHLPKPQNLEVSNSYSNWDKRKYNILYWYILPLSNNIKLKMVVLKSFITKIFFIKLKLFVDSKS